jgi:hypothetical protein
MTITRTNLLSKLKSSIHDAGRVLNASANADWHRIIDNALQAISLPDGRPLVKLGSIELVAGQREYAAPSDFVAQHSHALWGMESRVEFNPWEPQFQTNPIRFSAAVNSIGSRVLYTSYPPSAGAIAQYGAGCQFKYYALHVLTDAACTLPDTDELILLTRCQIETMTELMIRNYIEPTSVMGAADDINGSPQQVYTVLAGRYFGMCRA